MTWLGVAAFIAAMIALNRYLRRREADGSFDAGPSSASQPGLRRFFDYGSGGWSESGARQRSDKP